MGSVLAMVPWEGAASSPVLLLPPLPEPSCMGCYSCHMWDIWDCPVQLSLYDSDHIFLLLQKRSGVQNSYVTLISLLTANTSICRRVRKSSNKLKSSGTDLSLAEALQSHPIPGQHCQGHWWPFRTDQPCTAVVCELHNKMLRNVRVQKTDI